MNLEVWAEDFANSRELSLKRAVRPVLEMLDPRGEGRFYGLGDDCGYLWDGRDHLLLATDAIREELLERPRYAGFCAVNVAMNDIYATGGFPLALVDTLHVPAGDEDWARGVAAGLREGCDFFEVAMLGGHIDADADRRGLSVAALGRASSIMGTFGATAGDVLLYTFDPEGRWDGEARIWDASSGRPPERVLDNYAVLPEIAVNGLVSACRDVSNAGLPGTLAMLAAASGVGAWLDLDRVPRPAGVELEEWLQAFPSYGFLFTLPPAKARGVEELLRTQGLAAAACGEIREGIRLAFSSEGKEIEIDNPLCHCSQ